MVIDIFGSPYQPMEVLTAVVYDASLIHPTANAIKLN